MPRLKSEIFVSALLRRVFAEGGFAAVEHSGEASAGAIFIKRRDRLGRVTLAGPAPQTAFGEGEEKGRKFELRLADAEEADVAVQIERERRFDPDLWLVELECDGELSAYLDLV